MKKKILSALLLCMIALSASAQHKETRVFQLSFISPFGTNGLNSYLVTNKISLNLLGGYSYGNTAVEFGGLYNANTHMTKGVQFAGILNYSGQSFDAVQIAGVTNIAARGVVGSQVGAVANVAQDASSQLSGVVNVASEVSGAQIAGVVNTAKEVEGLQLAGVINAAGEVKGTQLAGVGNIALQGSVVAQIGTVFNTAREVKGAQVGLINYADNCAGVQIGLINIVKHGGKHEFEISVSDALNTAVSFKLGSNKLYTIFSVGVNYINKPLQYAYGVGLGTHQNWGRNWGSQIEVAGYQLSEEGRFQGGLDLLGQFKFTVSKQLANHFKVFFGPIFNMTISNYVNPMTGKIGGSLAPYTVWEQTNGKTNLQAWVGFVAGVRF